MSKKGQSILLVEDDRDLLSRLRNTLAQEDYEVYIAENGQEARKILASRMNIEYVLEKLLS